MTGFLFDIISRSEVPVSRDISVLGGRVSLAD